MNPDVLVLGGGGILGEAWMSAVLAGIQESGPFKATACRSYIGTSAGSIVAAVLCAGIDPGSRLGRLPEQPPTALPEPSGDSLAGRLAQPSRGRCRRRNRCAWSARDAHRRSGGTNAEARSVEVSS